MSVGYAPTAPPPFDPNDPQALAAAGGTLPPVPPVAVPNPTPLPTPTPMPAPAGLDQPPAPAGLSAPPDAAAIAAKMQPGALGPAAGPTPAPGAPPPAPASAAPTEAAKPPADAMGDLQRAQDDEKKAREAAAQATLDHQKAQQASAEANARVQTQRQDEEKRALEHRNQVIQQYQTAEQAAQEQIQQTKDAVKNFKFRDYFANDEGGTNWARKIGAALAAGLGAFGAGLTHGPNYALQILNKDMDDAHQHDIDHLNQLKDQEVMARTGLTDIGAARQKALADLTVNDAARDRYVAAQLDSAAAQQTVASAGPTLKKAAADLNLDAAQKETAAKKALVELNMKLADESRKKQLDEASITEKNAAANLHNVQAGAGGFARTAHGHGGGGPANPKVAEAEGTLSQMIADKKPYPELVAFATANHVPLTGKSGQTSLKTLIDGAGAVGKQDGSKGEQHALDKLPTDFNKDLSVNGVMTGTGGAKGLLPTNRTLQKLLHAVDSDNPLSAKEAFLAFDAAARGGTATQGSIDALQKTLGGSVMQFQNWLESKSTGGLSEDSKARFRDAIREAVRTNVDQANTAHESMVGKYFAPDYYGLKQHVESQFGVFDGFRDEKGHHVFHVARDAAAPGIDRATGKKLAPGAAAAQASSHPSSDAPGTIRKQNGHKYQLGADGQWQPL